MTTKPLEAWEITINGLTKDIDAFGYFVKINPERIKEIIREALALSKQETLSEVRGVAKDMLSPKKKLFGQETNKYGPTMEKVYNAALVDFMDALEARKG